MSVIVFSLVIAIGVGFLMRRQSQSTEIIISELLDAESRRLLSDVGMILASHLKDDRDFYKNHYSCKDTLPIFLKVSDVGIADPLYKDVYFSCHLPTTYGEFYLKLEKRSSLGRAPVSSVKIQGSKCRKTIFSFDTAGAPPNGKILFYFDTNFSDKSDHVWTGGINADAMPGCTAANVTCYSWNTPTTITLKSNCASAMTTAHLENANISKLNSTFKDMPVIEEIHMYSNQLTSLPANVFKGLSKLNKLHIHINKLASIDANLLHDLANLENFAVSDNLLTTLDVTQFQGNSKLKYLYLNSNSFAGGPLPKDVFSGLALLQELYNSNSKLPSIIAGTFDGLVNLSRLELHLNKIANLPVGIFTGLSQLKILYLHYNKIASPLDSSIFSNLPSLENLQLANNSLTSFHADPFQGTKNIKYLGLGNEDTTGGIPQNDYSLSPLPDTVFQGLGELYELKIQKSKLASILPNTFSGLAKLDRLELHLNQLSTLSVGTFNGLPKLKILYLHYNKIASPLDSSIFSNLPSLENLQLANNSLTSFHADPFQGTKNIRYLGMGNEDTTTGIPQNDYSLAPLPATVFQGLGELNELKIQKSKLTSILPNTFSGLAKLERLELHSNQLSNLAVGTFNGLPKLKFLYMHYNLIAGPLDTNLFSGMNFLEYLALGYTQLNAIHLDDLMDRALLMPTLRYLHIPQTPPISVSVTKVNALKAKGVTVEYNP